MRSALNKSRRHRPPGFSLIELMVVLVLIGIMSAMLIPEMRGTFEDALLRSTARELIDASRLAHSKAVARQQPYQLRLDPREGRYWVERATPHTPSRSRSNSDSIPEVTRVDGTLDRRITVQLSKRTGQSESQGRSNRSSDPFFAPNTAANQADERVILFKPDGTAEAAEIVLRDRDGFGLALRIHPTTARIRLVELARE